MAADLDTILAEERRIMNFYAPHYRGAMLFNSYGYQEQRRAFADWVLETLKKSGQDPTRLSFLDVGCATGVTLEHFARAGCRRLVGLDMAEEMLANHPQLPDVRLVHGSVEHHDWGSETFDTILIAFSLHHLHDPRSFFAMVDRLTKSGGWFFVLEYNAAAWPIPPILASPARALFKWKNRKKLARWAQVPPLFHPGHKLLSHTEILEAIPDREAYDLTWRTNGLLLPLFNYALMADCTTDRWLHALLRKIDRAVEPFGAGHFQWIAGRRR